METGERERYVMSSETKQRDWHAKWCVKWENDDYFCDCGFDQIDSYFDHEEPPIRQSKSAKPKHEVSGRSIFTLWDKIRGK